ncbi:RICIN domain-containing protein [Streptomyces sp. URMC 129]|uniref:RICIN domain-containing protein n=1 Tax=Streptomyces sp. URMC 129 TaxID=3423407 RepID=UPI003F1D280C
MKKRTWIRTLLAPVLCAGALVTTSGATGAEAAPRDEGVTVLAVNTFQSLGTLRCMDDSDEGFRTLWCNGSDHQKWNVHVFNDGTRRFQNVATGRCIYDGPHGFSTQFCGSSENVSWYVVRHHEVRMTLRNEATDDCIDDSEHDGFRMVDCNGTQYQDWV